MKQIVSLLVVLLIGVTAFSQRTEDVVEKRYPEKRGQIRMEKRYIYMGNIDINGVHTGELKIYNSSDEEITLEPRRMPRYLKIEAPRVLGAQEEAVIKVTFDSKERQQYGRFAYNLVFNTNDPEAKGGIFNINFSAVAVEDFTKLTDEQRANAPKIKFEETHLKIEEVKQGELAHYSFKFKNEGKSDLIIRKTKASCGCTAAEPEKKVLKPGESSSIEVDFDTKRYSGKKTKSVTIISNDPENSTTRLMLTANITVN
jgi:hypothetical protein